MTLTATESTAVKLFSFYRTKERADDRTMATVGSLQITPQDLAEMLTSFHLLGTSPVAAGAPARDIAEVDIAEGLNALSTETPKQRATGA